MSALSPIPLEPRKKFTARQRAEIFREAGGICHICGGKIGPGEAWDIEHVTALSMGGTNEADNLRPAHVKCHREKTADDVSSRAKADRIAAKHFGFAGKKPKSPWRRKLNGQVVRRDQ